MRSEEGEVILEGIGCGGEDGEGSEGFGGDGAEEAALGGGGDEGFEGGVELVGGWEGESGLLDSEVWGRRVMRGGWYT